jgi:hypothetical protein
MAATAVASTANRSASPGLITPWKNSVHAGVLEAAALADELDIDTTSTAAPRLVGLRLALCSPDLGASAVGGTAGEDQSIFKRVVRAQVPPRTQLINAYRPDGRMVTSAVRASPSKISSSRSCL